MPATPTYSPPNPQTLTECLRTNPHRYAHYAETHPVQPLKGLREPRAASVFYRASVPAGHAYCEVAPFHRASAPAANRQNGSFKALSGKGSAPATPLPFRHTPFRPRPRHTAPVWRNLPQNPRCGEFFTFSAKEKDSETGLSYFGSRYYSSDLSVWLSVDPMSDKYASLSPYTYCADNPVKLVDPNGDTIVIKGYDGNFIYTHGFECTSADWKVRAAWNNLDKIYGKKAGKTVIDEMSKDNSPSFVFTDESLFSDGTGRFQKDDKGGGTMYMGGQLESVYELAHELFHGYQEVKGQGGPSIHNEVEAFLFAGLFSDKMSNGLFVRSGGCDQEYIQAVANLLFGENYNNFNNDFKRLIKGFKSQSSANFSKKYENMDLYRVNQTEDLFKLLVK